MTASQVMLVCGQCSLRIRGMQREDIPENGIVCRCGHRLFPAGLQADPGRRRPRPLPECSLRGEQLSDVACGCQGKVRVFACSHPDNVDGLALSSRPAALQGLPEGSLPSCRQCPFHREPPEVTAQPTLLQMGISATAAAFTFAASGGKLLSRKERDSRLATCKGCPALNGPQCTDCGCLVAVKSWLPAERCPRKKWPGE